MHNAMYNIAYYGRRISRNRQNRIRRKCIITHRPEFLYNIYIIYCIKTDLGVRKNRTKRREKITNLADAQIFFCYSSSRITIFDFFSPRSYL